MEAAVIDPVGIVPLTLFAFAYVLGCNSRYVEAFLFTVIAVVLVWAK